MSRAPVSRSTQEHRRGGWTSTCFSHAHCTRCPLQRRSRVGNVWPSLHCQRVSWRGAFRRLCMIPHRGDFGVATSRSEARALFENVRRLEIPMDDEVLVRVRHYREARQPTIRDATVEQSRDASSSFTSERRVVSRRIAGSGPWRPVRRRVGQAILCVPRALCGESAATVRSYQVSRAMSPTYHRRCFPNATCAMSTSGTS